MITEKNGFETVFIQILLVNFTNKYKEITLNRIKCNFLKKKNWNGSV